MDLVLKTVRNNEVFLANACPVAGPAQNFW